MKKISIDFHQTKKVPTLRQLGFVLLILAILLNTFLMNKTHKNAVLTHELSNKLEGIQHPAKVIPKLNGDEDQAIKSQLKDAQEVTAKLNLPWPQLLKVLEDTRDVRVDLLAVTPNAQSGEVFIVGQSDNLQHIFDYIERLKKSLIFSKVELNDHQKIALNERSVLRFTIAAHWVAIHE